MILLQYTLLEITYFINIILDGIISTFINNFLIHVFDYLTCSVNTIEIFCLAVYNSDGVIQKKGSGFTISKECFRIRTYTYLTYVIFAIFGLLSWIFLSRFLAAQKEALVQTQEQQNVTDSPQKVTHPEVVAPESSQQALRTQEKSLTQKEIMNAEEQSVQNNEPMPEETENVPPLKNANQEEMGEPSFRLGSDKTTDDKETSIEPSTQNAPVKRESPIKQEKENKEPGVSTAQENVGAAEPAQQENPDVSTGESKTDTENERKRGNESEQVQSTAATNSVHDQRSKQEEEVKSPYVAESLEEETEDMINEEDELIEQNLIEYFQLFLSKLNRQSDLCQQQYQLLWQKMEEFSNSLTQHLDEFEQYRDSPSNGEKESSLDEKKSNDDEVELSVDETKPSHDGIETGIDDIEPSVDDTKPSVGDAKPSGDDTKPSGDDTKPSGDKTESDDDETKPSGDDKEEIVDENERIKAYKQKLIDGVYSDFEGISNQNYEAFNQRANKILSKSSSFTSSDACKYNAEDQIQNLLDHQMITKELHQLRKKELERVMNTKFTLNADGKTFSIHEDSPIK